MSLTHEQAAESFTFLAESARQAESSGDWDTALKLYTRAAEGALAQGDAGAGADLYRAIGITFFRRGDYDKALAPVQRALQLAQDAGEPKRIAAALNCIAGVEQARGHSESAEAIYHQAGAMAAEAGDQRLVAFVEQNLGMLASIRGDVETALTRYQSALASYQEIGDEVASAWALNNIGKAHVLLAHFEDARAAFDKAFVLAERAHDINTLGDVELNRAEMYLQQQEFMAAREHCDRAYEIYGRLDTRKKLGDAHKVYGSLYREMGRMVLADTHLDLVVGIARECGDVLLEAESEYERALVHLAEARQKSALLSLSNAHRLFTDLHAQRELVDVDARLGRLEDTYLLIVKAWGESIESKDRYTAGHCQRVADYACMLATRVGFVGHDLVWFRMGALLHDVGKTEVPAEILNKPGSLTSEEWDLMKSHTTRGDRMVAEVGFPWDIGPMVRNHHERYDGTGYPDQLKGEEIPLSARALCIADIFDALTTTRSYRPAYTFAEALKIMDQDAGTVIDPQLFAIFKGLVEN
jgi:putative nucleotidyltransferase with HDIG domain